MNAKHQIEGFGEADAAKQAANKKMARKVLWCLIAFFVIFASVDAYFIYMAVNSHSGEVARAPQTVEQAKPHD